MNNGEWEEYQKGVNRGIERVKYHLENPSCLYCEYGFVTEDWSVGIPPHLDACNNEIVIANIMDDIETWWNEKYGNMKLDDKNFVDFEEFAAKNCGFFKLDYERLKEW